MKSKFRFFSMALAVLMLVPLLATFAVSAETTPVAYADANDGDLLRTFNFKQEGWEPDFASDSNKGAEITIADDGNSAVFKVLSSSSKRSMWGDTLVDTLPLAAGVKYTFVFNLTFGTDNLGFAFYPDAENGLLIRSNGYVHWASWNKNAVDANAAESEKWTTVSDIDAKETQTFAVEMDYDAKTYNLYVKKADGSFAYVVSKTRQDGWTADTEMTARFYTRAMKVDSPDGTATGDFSSSGITVGDSHTITVANLKIYKGLNGSAPRYGYADAEDGEILYKANFKGDSVWTPVTGAESTYDTMVAETSADGSSVTLTAPEKDHDKGRAVWGGALDTNKYQAPGSAYTVEFTVTTEDADAEVGFYPDWGTGFIVAPGLNRFRFGQWGNQTKVHSTDYYLGTGALTQTYAVEFAVSTETFHSGSDDFYKVTDYRLFVKNGNEWMLIYELSDDVNCSNIADTTELGSMQWTTVDYEMVLRFFRSPSQGTKPVTVSNTIVRKGLLSSTLEAKQPTTGGIDVTSKEEGELLYKVNFNGDDYFTPGAMFEGFPTLTTAVDATDSGKVTISVPTEEDGLFHFWGGEIKGLELNDTNQYTIFVTVERSKELSATDPKLGISVDGKYYVLGDSSYMQLVKGGDGKVHSEKKYADDVLYTVVGDHGNDYDLTTAPFTQTIAIEIDGPEHNTRAIRVYALTDDGTYHMYTNTDSADNVQFFNDNLSIYFSQKSAGQSVTIKDVEIYKGRTIEALNAALEEEEEPGETNTTTAPVTTEAPAANVTTEEPARKKGGCKSMVSSSCILAVVAVMGVSVTFVKKKKEND